MNYIFGLPGNTVLARQVEAAAHDVRVRRAESAAPVLRRYTELAMAPNPGRGSGESRQGSRPARRNWTSGSS